MAADYWLSKCKRLRVDRSTGDTAPHKPILLLVLFDLIEAGEADGATIELTPEIAFRFVNYWSIVASRRPAPPDVRLPFHHLSTVSSDGFWDALTLDGSESSSPRTTRLARLNTDFAAVAREESFRNDARRVLVETYFEDHERPAFYELLGLPIPETVELERIRLLTEFESARQAARSARFRVTVVAAYRYACALTGHRLTTITGASVVDAAHIHQFADSRNDDPRNGIALSKNSHWLFDNGLWTLDEGYRVVVATRSFREESPDQKQLLVYHGSQIRLPDDEALHPQQEYIRWHRENVFCE